MPTAHARPGDGPRRLMWKWRRHRVVAGAIVTGAVLLALRQPEPTWVWLGLAASGTWLWYQAGTRIQRARSGIRGEEDVAAILGHWATVTYGWAPPGSRYDVDAVVTWPTIAAIEVKNATGRVRIGRDGSVTVGGSRLPGRPLRQATRGAAAVRRHLDLDEPVEAILCVTGMRERPRWVDDNGSLVALCAPRHLRRVLRRLPRWHRHSARDLLVALSDSD